MENKENTNKNLNKITKIKKNNKKSAKVKKTNEEKANIVKLKKIYNNSIRQQKNLTKNYSTKIWKGEQFSNNNYIIDSQKYFIELNNVKKSYFNGEYETKVLKGINIKLEKGHFIVILGPSGSGKTTLLNLISGLDKTTSGDVFVLGYNLSYLKDSHLTKFRRDYIGFIFQSYNLLTNLTAKENTEVGSNLAKKQGLKIEDIFETIGMSSKINNYPHQLSGGEQQRVSIARALAKNPSILFGDEPTGALDEEMGRKVLEILIKINKELKTSIIIVTHNPHIARIADTVLHVKNGTIDKFIINENPVSPSDIEWG